MPDAYLPRPNASENDFSNLYRSFLDVLNNGVLLTDDRSHLIGSLITSVNKLSQTELAYVRNLLVTLKKAKRIVEVPMNEDGVSENISTCELAVKLAEQEGVEVIFGDESCHAIRGSTIPLKKVIPPWHHEEFSQKRQESFQKFHRVADSSLSVDEFINDFIYPFVKHSDKIEILDRNIGRLPFNKNRGALRGEKNRLRRRKASPADTESAVKNFCNRPFDFRQDNYDRTIDWLCREILSIRKGRPLELVIYTELSDIYTNPSSGRVSDDEAFIRAMTDAVLRYKDEKEKQWNRDGLTLSIRIGYGVGSFASQDHDRHWRTDYVNFSSSLGLDMLDAGRARDSGYRVKQNRFVRATGKVYLPPKGASEEPQAFIHSDTLQINEFFEQAQGLLEVSRDNVTELMRTRWKVDR